MDVSVSLLPSRCWSFKGNRIRIKRQNSRGKISDGQSNPETALTTLDGSETPSKGGMQTSLGRALSRKFKLHIKEVPSSSGVLSLREGLILDSMSLELRVH